MSANNVSWIECSGLGLWMSLQSAVEKKHHEWRRTTDALAVSVQEAWGDLPVESINKIFSILLVVCQMIVTDGCSNLRVGADEIPWNRARVVKWSKEFPSSKKYERIWLEEIKHSVRILSVAHCLFFKRDSLTVVWPLVLYSHLIITFSSNDLQVLST